MFRWISSKNKNYSFKPWFIVAFLGLSIIGGCNKPSSKNEEVDCSKLDKVACGKKSDVCSWDDVKKCHKKTPDEINQINACLKNDNNETACKNDNKCSWIENPADKTKGTCQDASITNCHKYDRNENACQAQATTCTWEATDSKCADKALADIYTWEQIQVNATIAADATIEKFVTLSDGTSYALSDEGFHRKAAGSATWDAPVKTPGGSFDATKAGTLIPFETATLKGVVLMSRDGLVVCGETPTATTYGAHYVKNDKKLANSEISGRGSRILNNGTDDILVVAQRSAADNYTRTMKLSDAIKTTKSNFVKNYLYNTGYIAKNLVAIAQAPNNFVALAFGDSVYVVKNDQINQTTSKTGLGGSYKMQTAFNPGQIFKADAGYIHWDNTKNLNDILIVDDGANSKAFLALNAGVGVADVPDISTSPVASDVTSLVGAGTDFVRLQAFGADHVLAFSDAGDVLVLKKDGTLDPAFDLNRTAIKANKNEMMKGTTNEVDFTADKIVSVIGNDMDDLTIAVKGKGLFKRVKAKGQPRP